MPLIRAWNRRSLVWQLAVLCSVLMVIVGGLIVAIIALASAQNAGQEAKQAASQAKLTSAQAKQVANCVNDILGDRAGLQALDAAAHENFARDLQRVLLAAPAKQPAEYQRFLTELHNYVQTLERDQNYRTKHPLGRC